MPRRLQSKCGDDVANRRRVNACRARGGRSFSSRLGARLSQESSSWVCSARCFSKASFSWAPPSRNLAVQSVSAEQTQISLSPVPCISVATETKKFSRIHRMASLGLELPVRRAWGRLWEAVLFYGHRWMMLKNPPVMLDDQRVGASDSLTSISSCDLICCHAREDRSGSMDWSTVRFGSVAPSLKGRAELNNHKRQRSNGPSEGEADAQQLIFDQLTIAIEKLGVNGFEARSDQSAVDLSLRAGGPDASASARSPAGQQMRCAAQTSLFNGSSPCCRNCAGVVVRFHRQSLVVPLS